MFQLLETLYGAFDQVARQRGIYKVETIGGATFFLPFNAFMPSRASRLIFSIRIQIVMLPLRVFQILTQIMVLLWRNLQETSCIKCMY